MQPLVKNRLVRSEVLDADDLQPATLLAQVATNVKVVVNLADLVAVAVLRSERNELKRGAECPILGPTHLALLAEDQLGVLRLGQAFDVGHLEAAARGGPDRFGPFRHQQVVKLLVDLAEREQAVRTEKREDLESYQSHDESVPRRSEAGRGSRTDLAEEFERESLEDLEGGLLLRLRLLRFALALALRLPHSPLLARLVVARLVIVGFVARFIPTRVVLLGSLSALALAACTKRDHRQSV